MTLLLIAVAVMGCGGTLALLAGRRRMLSSFIGAWSVSLGAVAGLAGAVQNIWNGSVESYSLVWPLPFSDGIQLGLDPLSSVFLIPLFSIALLAAIYGVGYLAHDPARRSAGIPWFFFNLLVAGMAFVMLARDVLSFLIAWETMAVASFFLVVHEHEKRSVQQAGWLYLVATHVGTLFVMLFFFLLAREHGVLSFEVFAESAGENAVPAAGLLFLLAVIGFGTKAGFMPLHIWLPEAHPAAPSHVSALMSAVMIKTGIYGLIRALTFLGPPPAWWGLLLIGVGLASGLVGILFALGQRDIKRLLAYSSVENIGVIALGIGLGLLGMARHSIFLIIAGFTGAFLHTINHAIFKGLLFLGSGIVYHATGTREINRLGGLLRRMPRVGTAFLIGCAAIAAFPPFNGFVGEFLIYLGAFHGAVDLYGADAAACIAVGTGLALIGGLALVCFVKMFGITFLGEPRSSAAADATEPSLWMMAPLLTLAALCAALGLSAPFVAQALSPAIAQISRLAPGIVQMALQSLLVPMYWSSLVAAEFFLLVAALGFWRRFLLAQQQNRNAVTWDCGYLRPTPRMQYTGASFVQPVVDIFSPILRKRYRSAVPKGYFPADSSFSSELRDVFRETMFLPLYRIVDRWLSLLRWVQQGRVQLYILYIIIALLAALAWTWKGLP